MTLKSMKTTKSLDSSLWNALANVELKNLKVTTTDGAMRKVAAKDQFLSGEGDIYYSVSYAVS